ncbi:MAG: tRNA (adenosine(37)-N6)-threonylcarbamoyltransferase complex dimerization subunit type 1 TsaB [Desulfobacterales bacterium]|jgi:tRNA threonylcarbamoyladenosine biosynthesis protein TsaB|nr:tRNA (adenosine(37)-N6)-threonylcarbamoyltransferase complex dimerization subunit type 1 TsaB [Desulfobacterales bacterium]
MKVLAVDTATRACSVAIAEPAGLICELSLRSGQTHSANLLNLVRSALAIAGTEVAQIGGLGVTIGPGSFTGLRIGLSVVKGLALALGRQVAGVSSLHALAHPFGHWPGLVCALLDARKGEVYYNRYDMGGHGCRARGPDAVGPIEQALTGIHEPCLFVGDGARLHRERIIAVMGDCARFAGGWQDAIQAAAVADLALSAFGRQQAQDAQWLAPRYVRRSEAELAERSRRAARVPAGGAGSAETAVNVDKFPADC